MPHVALTRSNRLSPAARRRCGRTPLIRSGDGATAARPVRLLNVLTLQRILARLWQKKTRNRRRRHAGDVCKVADKSLRLGTVEAADKRAPIEKAAIEFKTDIWRLYGLPRR